MSKPLEMQVFRHQHNRFMGRVRLLDGATGVTVGRWCRINGYYPLSVTIDGEDGGGAPFVATVKVLVTNSIEQPSDASVNFGQIGPDVTAPQPVVITAPYEWVKVIVSAYTSG